MQDEHIQNQISREVQRNVADYFEQTNQRAIDRALDRLADLRKPQGVFHDDPEGYLVRSNTHRRAASHLLNDQRHIQNRGNTNINDYLLQNGIYTNNQYR